MPKKKTSTKKTVSHSNKNKNTQKVVVNVNTESTTRKQTSRKGVQSFSKGNSYLGGTVARGVNYPSTTVINNMPSPSPMPMFPQVDTNRLSAIENLAQNIATQGQHLHGRINASPDSQILGAMSVLPQSDREIMQQSRTKRYGGSDICSYPYEKSFIT